MSGTVIPEAVIETLPIISLWQPWASLIFAPGRPKRHETRSWRYAARLEGQQVGIHAAATFPSRGYISDPLRALCVEAFGEDFARTLPRGCLVGTARLVGCHPTTDAGNITHRDAIAGDWSPGRFAWTLDDVRALPAPLPMKGRQGWWRMPRADLDDAFGGAA